MEAVKAIPKEMVHATATALDCVDNGGNPPFPLAARKRASPAALPPLPTRRRLADRAKAKLSKLRLGRNEAPTKNEQRKRKQHRSCCASHHDEQAKRYDRESVSAIDIRGHWLSGDLEDPLGRERQAHRLVH